VTSYFLSLKLIINQEFSSSV